jgi:hypothetical protein
LVSHGAQSYFVLGEGLLSESGERPEPRTPLRDTDTVGPFRYSRLGPRDHGPQLGEPLNRRVARAMTAGLGEFGHIPAGFTYLGQFLDHDLTFDRTFVSRDTNVSPSELLQGRSPSLDLDAIYGAGPGDPESARFYSDGVHLRMGTTDAVGHVPAKSGFDLPRVGTGRTAAKKRRAQIPDRRNDENLAVAQIHLALIRFHNRVVDTLPRSLPTTQRFTQARDAVVKHYQWMLRTDYLPRIASRAVVDSVFRDGRRIFEVGATAMDVATLPIEFSVAAFRLGHSMIRSQYSWNREFPSGYGTLDFLFMFSGTSGDLAGSERLPSNWIPDFRRLFDFREARRPDLAPPKREFNRAMRIDTTLAPMLHNLATGSFGVPAGGIEADLAYRTLMRARFLRLATGQQMVRFVRSKGVDVVPLSKAQIRDGGGGAVLDDLTRSQRDAFLRATPLWFYILREAELNNGKLTDVGARIVVETFHRAMEASMSSIVRDTSWRPHLGPDGRTFRMVDLMLFAFEGSEELLAPLG